MNSNFSFQGESLNDIQRFSLSSDDLTDTIVRNSQCQKMLANHGDPLLSNHRLSFLVQFSSNF